MKYHIPVLLLSFLLTFQVYGQEISFIEESTERGIDHVFTQNGFIGGGAAFFDFDNDGDDDIYITAGTKMDRLYENDGSGNFTDKSLEAGIVTTEGYYTTGVCTGDLNNDGYDDIFVTTRESDYESFAKNICFINQGDGTFIDIWWGIDVKDFNYSIGPNLFDFDLDGDLDIFITTYIEEANVIRDDDGEIIEYDHLCFENIFYENNGNLEFSEISDEVGLQVRGCALASIATDYDADGDLDLLIANDFGEFITPNQLFRNMYPIRMFEEISLETNFDQAMYGMGITHTDIDHDGDYDYYVSNFGQNVLMINDEGSFLEQSKDYNLDDTYIEEDSLLSIGWGTIFFDVDNDIDSDMYIGNGYIPAPDFIPSTINQPDRLLINENGVFQNANDQLSLTNRRATRGVVYSDIDNDGDLDLLVIIEKVPLADNTINTLLFVNHSTHDNNYIQVELHGEPNQNAYGSEVVVYSDSIVSRQELVSGASHCSQNSSILHFGLSTHEAIDSIIVFWTGDRDTTIIHNPTINDRLQIIQNTPPADSMDTISTVSENLNLNNIILYPNPAKEKIFILNEALSNTAIVNILDINGKEVKSKIVINSDHSISMVGLHAGLYLLTIKDKFNSRSIPFVKI